MRSFGYIRLVWTLAVILGVFGAPLVANAQYVADSTQAAGSGYSGGSYTMQGVPFSFPYTMNNDGWGGGTSSGTCSGQVTAVFKWIGNSNNLPPAVLVEEISYADTFNQISGGVTGAGSADNDLQDGTVTINSSPGSPPVPIQEKTSGKNGDGTLIKHYRIIENPAATITLTISPIASCSGASAGSAIVRYTAKVTPIDIIFQGGIGNNWEKKYLIGQRANATLQCELEAEDYEWIPSGGGPFDQFEITSTTGHFIGMSDQLTEEFSACFSEDGDLMLEATAHLIVPSGSKPTAGFDLDISREFCMLKPTYTTAGVDSIGALQLRSSHDGCDLIGSFSAGGSTYGVGVRGAVTVPSGFNEGKWDWVQTITEGGSRVVSGVTQHLNTGSPGFFTTGHDGSWPYDTVYPPYDFDSNHYWQTGSTNRSVEDTVGASFESIASSWHFQLDFKTYAMFVPPGTGSQNVPVHQVNWGCAGDFVNVGTPTPNTWAVSGTPTKYQTTISDPNFPNWDRIISAIAMGWH